MGLFRKKKQKPAQQPSGSLQSLEYWRGLPKNPVGTYRWPTGPERAIYDYDGACLAGLKAGDTFIVNPIPADVTLKSVYNGNVSSTQFIDGLAYVYDGRVFGLSNACAHEIAGMLRTGYIVEVEARIAGFDNQLGYPKVVGLFGKPTLK